MSDPYESDRDMCDRLEAMVNDLTTQNHDLAIANGRLWAGLKAVEGLINDSHGVAGLHLNGDVASWDELRTGGRFEEWLRDFDAALSTLDDGLWEKVKPYLQHRAECGYSYRDGTGCTCGIDALLRGGTP